jgi:glycosyltransferase involved in cell wall biosynthesis
LKRVLIITYYWPPNGGSGVQRWLKFAKYLPEFGWQPIVFTPENPLIAQRDDSLMKDVSRDLQVIKYPIWDPVAMLQKRSGDPNVGLLQKDKKAGWKAKLMAWLRGNLLIPDPKVFWVRPASKFLIGWLKSNPVDVVVTTGPPHSMHLIGMRLQKYAGVKWVADFRDPWTKIDFFHDLMPNYLTKKLHHNLERKVVQRANSVIGISQEICEDYELLGGKITKLTNGFDPADFFQGHSEKPQGFVIGHIGNLVPSRNPDVFWKALGVVLDEIPEFREHLKIKLVGNVDVSVHESIKANSLQEFVELISYKPHNEVILELFRCRILLLLVNNTPNAAGILTGKLFEYMAAKRFIFAIGPPGGELDHVISETQTGIVHDFDDEAKMIKTIKDLFGRYLKGDTYIQNGKPEKFSRLEIAGNLAELLINI